jgi:glyoxylase I family protein
MILGLHHAAITVANLEDALAFYCDIIGFEIVMEAELPPGIDMMNEAMDLADASFKVRMIKKGNSCIELFEFNTSQTGKLKRPVNRQGITHIALTSDNISADYERLASNGVTFNSTIVGVSPSRFVYGRDPFGNVIELLEHDGEGAAGLSY